MQFVPESNGEEVLPHHGVGDDAEALEVDDPEQYHGEAIACELPPGGRTFSRSGRHPRSATNRGTSTGRTDTDSPRLFALVATPVGGDGR
jgi:hypothetical protein